MSVASSSSSTKASKEDAQSDLLNALSALRATGRYSDLTITCNYREWAVHKAIVCSRSGFFDGACSNSFQEAYSGVIDLSEEDEEAVEQMIQFFYHLDYCDQPEESRATAFQHRTRSSRQRQQLPKPDLSHIEDPLLSQAGVYIPDESSTTLLSSSASENSCTTDSADSKSSFTKSRSETPTLASDSEGEYESMSEEEEDESESHLVLHTRVYALAEKYDIPYLKELSKSKFEIAMACFYDSPEFAQAIEEVYCSTIDTDRGLRDIVLEAFKNHPQLANTQDVFTVIRDTPSLALELFKVERGIPVR